MKGADSHVTAQDDAYHVTKIRGDGEVAALVELRFTQTRPSSVHSRAAHPAARHPHHVAVPVVGAAVAILPYRAAKFGHDEDYGILVGGTHLMDQSGQAVAQRPQVIGQLSIG